MNYYLIEFEVKLPPKRWVNFAKFEKVTKLVKAVDLDDARLKVNIYIQQTYPNHLSIRGYKNHNIEWV